MRALTIRQNEIMALVCTGLTNRAIALRLHIAPNTVRNHIYTIYQRVGLFSRAAVAVAYALEEAAK